MNKVILLGRLTGEPKINETQGEKPIKIARFSLAVNRAFRREGQPTADFINCVAYSGQAEFIEKYFHKGSKIAIAGRIQTGSYTKRDGTKVYTTDVIVEEADFADSKSGSEEQKPKPKQKKEEKPKQPQQTGYKPWADVPPIYDDFV